MDQRELLLPEGESLSTLADFYRVFADEHIHSILLQGIEHVGE